jgi:hypothetical protein
MSDEPRPYESPAVETVDTGGMPIETNPGGAQSPGV